MKNGGKNRNPIDGFYETVGDGPKERYFIKKPKDEVELFIEGLIGRFYTKLMQEGLIPKPYHNSFICADFIKCADNSYALIQPLIKFTELYKIIQTGYKDRNALFEMFFNRYANLTKLQPYFGLSEFIMFAILVGNYSVHSGNIVVLEETHKMEDGRVVRQFAGIDNGAANRDFAHPENNKNILFPYEYQRHGYTKFTKNYIANYKGTGVYSSMAKHAEELSEKLKEKFQSIDFTKIVEEVFKELPSDLLKENDTLTRKKLAEYTCIPAFETETFGKEGQCPNVIKVYSEILNLRLQKLCELKSQDTQAPLYVSTEISESIGKENIEEELTLSLDMQKSMSFPERMESWLKLLSKEKVVIDFTQINYDSLVKEYNCFLNVFADNADFFNLWQHDYQSTLNLLVPSTYKEIKDLVPHYREGVVLRRLYSVNEKKEEKARLAAYIRLNEEYLNKEKKEKSEPSVWSKMTELLCRAQRILDLVKNLKNGQQKIDQEHVNKLLLQFKESLDAVNQLFAESTKFSSLNSDNLIFYPISDEDLNEMSGEQLLTVCLEELPSMQRGDFEASPLLVRIISADSLYHKMKKAAENKTGEEIGILKKWGENFRELRTTMNEFLKDSPLESNQKFEELPLSLQEKVREEVEALRVYLNDVEKFLTAATSKDKIAAFVYLKDSYNNLPSDLKSKYQSDFKNYQEGYTYLDTCENFVARFQKEDPDAHRKESSTFLNAFEENFRKLSKELQLIYESNFRQYSDEIKFIISCLNFTSAPVVEHSKILDFIDVLAKINQLPTPKQITCKKLFDEVKSLSIEFVSTCYESSIAQKFLDEISKVEPELSTQLKITATEDEILWDAIATSQVPLTTEIANDLLVLKQFLDDKVQTDSKNTKFVKELNSFYKESLKIRLSGDPIKTQAHKIMKKAKEGFSHRDYYKRLLADFLIAFSVLFAGLGAIILMGRYLNNQHPLLSCSKTAREEELKRIWMRKPKDLSEGTDGFLFIDLKKTKNKADPDRILLEPEIFLN